MPKGKGWTALTPDEQVWAGPSWRPEEKVRTIVELPLIKVRLKRGPVLGEVEEAFIQGLVAGDTFVFAGRLLRFEGVKELVAQCSPATGGGDPKIPAYGGGRLPLSTFLAERVRGILQDPSRHPGLPPEVRQWLDIQRWRSALPNRHSLLVEGFPRGSKQFIVAYCFEGRNAHQTLGMLLTRRMERMGLKPLGFVATDYVLGIWGLRPPTKVQLDQLFDEDMLGDDLEAWLDESALMKRTFRNAAIIGGLIERRFQGEEKSRRQVTISTDLVYDVLRKHQPDHVLLRAARADAATGLLDIRRLGEMLSRIQGRIVHKPLDRVSPLAVPVLLEIGRESVFGEASEAVLQEAYAWLVPGGELHIVDFGGQERLPAAFRILLRGWLRQFHVQPCDELERELRRLALPFRLDRPFRGYAQYAVARRPEGARPERFPHGPSAPGTSGEALASHAGRC